MQDLQDPFVEPQVVGVLREAQTPSLYFIYYSRRTCGNSVHDLFLESLLVCLESWSNVGAILMF